MAIARGYGLSWKVLGRERDDAISGIVTLRHNIAASEAVTLADAAVQLWRLAAMDEDDLKLALFSAPMRSLVASVLIAVERALAAQITRPGQAVAIESAVLLHTPMHPLAHTCVHVGASVAVHVAFRADVLAAALDLAEQQVVERESERWRQVSIEDLPLELRGKRRSGPQCTIAKRV